MKVLILGGSGLLGHKAYQILSKYFETFITFNDYDERIKSFGIFDENHIYNEIDAFHYETIEALIYKINPQVVINCIGIIKQVKEAQNPKISIYLNALLPHLLSDSCKNIGARLIQFSTDCVFSGKKGNYVETDYSDPEDLYGRTKFLSEVINDHSLTLRISIIGHELLTTNSLVSWFLSCKNGTVIGYTNAIYTGFPTIILCNEIARIITNFKDMNGLYHLSSEKISKHDLLNLINRIYRLNIHIIPDINFRCDRSLDSAKYRQHTNFVPPSWEEMTEEMYKDYLSYKRRNPI